MERQDYEKLQTRKLKALKAVKVRLAVVMYRGLLSIVIAFVVNAVFIIIAVDVISVSAIPCFNPVCFYVCLCTVAMTVDGIPYLMPLWFGYTFLS